MLCYSGKNTQSFQAAFYTSSVGKPHQSGVLWNRQLSGIMVTTLSYSVEYKVHEKNKCIEMNHLWSRAILVTQSTCLKWESHRLFSTTQYNLQEHRISITLERPLLNTGIFVVFPPIISPAQRRAFWCNLQWVWLGFSWRILLAWANL